MTTIQLDETHDPARRSWVESANRPDCNFPIQNLPFGVFQEEGPRQSPDSALPSAISSSTLEQLRRSSITEIENVSGLLQVDSLRPLMAQLPSVWTALRKALGRMLETGSLSQSFCEPHLVPIARPRC